MDLHVQVSKNNPGVIMRHCTDLEIAFNVTYLFGYLTTSENAYSLVDIDECVAELDNCHKNATCNNTLGGFECTCNIGFDGDGLNCTSKLVTWSISSLVFPCTVIHLHTFIQPADINECELETYPCSSSANCTDNDGSFNCICREGFEGDGFNCTGME